MVKKRSRKVPASPSSRLTLANRVTRLANQIRGQASLRPLGDYPSSVVDSQGCEFGYEMFYHLPYANHLAKLGVLDRTVSCLGTKCFYFFSPEHHEVHEKRDFVKYFDSIQQVPHERPDFTRWDPPDFVGHYGNTIDFGFDKPPLLIFNKFNNEFYHPPINFLSSHFLHRLIDATQNRFTIIYNRPISHIVHDHMPLGDLNEKEGLKDRGVVMAEDLYEQHRHLSFNEFQLCLLSASTFRISAQGGAAYLNAFFPGRLMIYHRFGAEQIHGNYDDYPRMGVTDLTLHNCEFEMLDQLQAADRKAA